MDQPKIAQKKPYVMSVKPGKYAWCACGLSKNNPYCDGSHTSTPFRPVLEEITEEKTVAWCGCKQTGQAPFCDGQHAKLP